jgi:hypothetical protein
MENEMENEGTPKSVDSAQGYINVRGELPDWYIRYLVSLCEWEENLTECSGF